MFTCRWAYCATICGSLSQLDEHISGHIEDATPVPLKGVKRRKIAPGVWVSLSRRTAPLGGLESQERSFQRISDILPPHQSQGGDTSISTDTTYPIPSFPQPPVLPLPLLADPMLAEGSQYSAEELRREIFSSQIEDAEAADEMLQDYSHREVSHTDLAADSPSSQKHTSVVRRRSASPFLPPTQAYSTQLEVNHLLSSSIEEPHSQSATFPPPTQSTQGSQPEQRSGDYSMEIGRAEPSQLPALSPPDIISQAMPPPAVPIVRRASVSRPLLFGSASALIDAGGISRATDAVGRENSGHGSPVVPPRRSVGFSFGSQLGSSNPEDKSG